jgi:regulator of replication initiation timing
VSGTAQDAPVPHLVDPPRRSPIAPPAPQFTIPADAVIGGPVGAAPEILTQTSPVGGPLIEVFQMISSLMTEVSELHGTVTAIEAEQSSVEEQYEALRASYLDLEEIMLREISDPEESNERKKKYKKKKNTPPMVRRVVTHPGPRMSPTTRIRRKMILQMKKIFPTLSRWVLPCPD